MKALLLLLLQTVSLAVIDQPDPIMLSPDKCEFTTVAVGGCFSSSADYSYEVQDKHGNRIEGTFSAAKPISGNGFTVSSTASSMRSSFVLPATGGHLTITSIDDGRKVRLFDDDISCQP